MQKFRNLYAILGIALWSVGGPLWAEPQSIKIGVIGPLSAKSSEDMGLSIVGGARVFLSDINTTGGIMGRPIELVIRDDQAKPEVGVAIARELVEKEKVVAVVGFANTGVALPSAKVLQEARIPLIVSGSTGATVIRTFMPPAYPVSYVFRTSASDELQPVVILDDVIDRRKLGRIALLHDESPYGQLGRQSVLAELERRKLKPVAVASFKVGETDMRAQLQQVKASGADVIVMYCLGTDAATLVKSAEKINLKLPMVGPWTLSQKTFIDQAGKSAEGARTSVTFIESELSSVKNQFSLNYRKINKVSQIPSAVAAAQTYDALRLISLAIFQANSTEGPQIQAALENLQYQTTSTVVSRYTRPFTKTDHEAVTGNMVIMGEIRNGQVAYAYKEDASSSVIMRTKSPAR
ncbi:ABC transporter substrate-binding protein [Dechloromonas sp.]|uniref:ABC transporter substrate-binding protein n=1 Tax=Dechloromonas sp. TaxID=1917218 RepID=UPI00286D8A15|nr:ABC transporter substrate-binding protein [Dechloromonas sp.]